MPVVCLCRKHITKACAPHGCFQVVAVVLVTPGLCGFHQAEDDRGQVLDGLGPVVCVGGGGQQRGVCTGGGDGEVGWADLERLGRLNSCMGDVCAWPKVARKCIVA